MLDYLEFLSDVTTKVEKLSQNSYHSVPEVVEIYSYIQFKLMASVRLCVHIQHFL